MAKYNCVELSVKEGMLEKLNQLTHEELDALSSANSIYIYRSTYTKKVYIGQTKKFLERHKQHFNGNEKKFVDAKFNSVIVFFSRYLDNGTALDDMERQLITYFNADRQESLQEKFKKELKEGNKVNRKNIRSQFVSYDSNVINRTGGNSVSAYRDREALATEVILPVWEQVLYPKGWVSTPMLEKLRASALVKYSPIKTLTNEQQELIDEVISNDKCYVINGDAGTGKTVLLTHLVAALVKKYPQKKVCVVVQPNWEETGKEIFKVFGMNTENISVMTSTTLINKGEKYDVIIVDESHKMSRKYAKQDNSFNKVYKISSYSKCESHLEIIQQIGEKIILMYDIFQAIRPCNVTREMFSKLTENYEKKFLKTQFRICTPQGKKYTSDDYINGIKWLLYKDTGLLDSKLAAFNPDFNRNIFNDHSPEAYFGYFSDSPLRNCIEWLERDSNFHPEHVNRVLSGLVENWKQSDGKKPEIKHFFEGDIARRWNSTQVNWINCADDDAEEQIGSVFAVQGIDLNKVGVLIGPDLKVENGKLIADPDNFYNVKGKFKKEEMNDLMKQEEFTLFVLDIYYVLLTRGIDGIRIGFWKNPSFQKYMEETLDIKQDRS